MEERHDPGGADVPVASLPDTAPPYFPFRTLTNLLVRMESEGIPRRLDRGYLSNMAGGSIAQFLTGLRALGLIDDEERPQPILTRLVDAREDRPRWVAELLRARYPWAVELGRDRATHQELEEAFRQHGVTGSTLRKAIAFYLQAARYASVELSPFFRETRGSGDAGPQRRAPRRPLRDRGRQTPTPPGPPTPPPVDLPPATNDVAQMRREYFDLLRKKADESTDVDAGLLDRIERLLGVLEGE